MFTSPTNFFPQFIPSFFNGNNGQYPFHQNFNTWGFNPWNWNQNGNTFGNFTNGFSGFNTNFSNANGGNGTFPINQNVGQNFGQNFGTYFPIGNTMWYAIPVSTFNGNFSNSNSFGNFSPFNFNWSGNTNTPWWNNGGNTFNQNPQNWNNAHPQPMPGNGAPLNPETINMRNAA